MGYHTVRHTGSLHSGARCSILSHLSRIFSASFVDHCHFPTSTLLAASASRFHSWLSSLLDGFPANHTVHPMPISFYNSLCPYIGYDSFLFSSHVSCNSLDGAFSVHSLLAVPRSAPSLAPSLSLSLPSLFSLSPYLSPSLSPSLSLSLPLYPSLSPISISLFLSLHLSPSLSLSSLPTSLPPSSLSLSLSLLPPSVFLCTSSADSSATVLMFSHFHPLFVSLSCILLHVTFSLKAFLLSSSVSLQ